ncbi:ROK family protein, partial [Actinomyces sp.]
MTTLLALDIGGTKVGWGIIEAGDSYEVTERGSIPTDARRGGADVAGRICELAASLVASHPQVAGVAVASAGVVDPATGDIVSATGTMPGWGGTHLGALLQAATGLPVRVLNDVHAHGLGEATLGAGRPYRAVLSIAVGTGIGGALVEDGRVSFGSRGIAGHVGHIHHHFAPDLTCSCGRKGHIEAFCSGSGITAWYDSLRSESDPEVGGGGALQEPA